MSRGAAGPAVSPVVGAPADAPRATVPEGSPASGVEAPASPTGFRDFASAARAVLADLRRRCPLRLWVVTRAAGDDQVVLVLDQAEHAYDARPGLALPWRDSLCARRVAGEGPTVAPDVEAVPAYATAPNREVIPVRAYVGVPLTGTDGELFGSLCAFDPDPQPPELVDVAPLVELQARLLSTVLRLELAHDAARRRAERAEAEAMLDALTGLANRRAFDALLEAEEARCRRYGHPAAVVLIDLNGLKQVNDSAGHAAGDALLRRAAAAMRRSTRAGDLVARLGGDEFVVLAVETDATGAEAKRRGLLAALVEAGIDAALGAAARRADGTLREALEAADARMYEHKRALQR